MMRDIRRGRAVVVERRARRRILYAVEIGSARRHVHVLMVGSVVISAWPPIGQLIARRQEIEAMLRLPPDG
jgi:hypothetical protein